MSEDLSRREFVKRLTTTGLVAAGALLSPGDGREAVASNRVA